MALVGFGGTPQEILDKLNDLGSMITTFQSDLASMQSNLDDVNAILASYGVAYAYTRAQMDTLLAGKTSPADVASAILPKADKATTIGVSGLATGGGDLSANRTIGVPVASQTEAEEATLDTKAMTPLKVKQSIFHWAQGLRNLQIFKATGTYIPTPNTRLALVMIQNGNVWPRTIGPDGDGAYTTINGHAGSATIYLRADVTDDTSWDVTVGTNAQQPSPPTTALTGNSGSQLTTVGGDMNGADTAALVYYRDGLPFLYFNRITSGSAAGVTGSVMIWEF